MFDESCQHITPTLPLGHEPVERLVDELKSCRPSAVRHVDELMSSRSEPNGASDVHEKSFPHLVT